MPIETTNLSVQELRGRYGSYDWTYHANEGRAEELMFRWPGDADEDVMVVVHQSEACGERFHYHDYFYFNFAVRGDFDTLCGRDRQETTVREGEFCGGQPFSGHAIGAHDNLETIIIGVLVRKSAMHEQLLPLLSPDARLFRFLVNPSSEARSDEFLHFSVAQEKGVVPLLELMVEEYASRRPGSQDVLHGLTLALFGLISRCQPDSSADKPSSTLEPIVHYIRTHPDTATLTGVAQQFGYSPTYLSGALRAETGLTFLQILTRERMERATLLLEGTELSIEAIARMLGYGSTSGFYRAYRRFFGCAPREQEGDENEAQA